DQVDIDALIAELVALQFLRLFEVDGREYGAIRNFRKWQKPKKPSHSGILPAELVGFVGIDPEELAKPVPPPAPEVPDMFPTVSARLENQFSTGGEKCFQKGGREEGKKEEEGSLRSPSPREVREAGTADEPPPGRERSQDPFDAFWGALPPEARTAPDYARKAHAKALGLGATPEGIIAALRRELRRSGGRLALSPAGWLKGGSWRLQEADCAGPECGAPPPRAVAAQAGGLEGMDQVHLDAFRRAAAGGWHWPNAPVSYADADERRADCLATLERRSPKAFALVQAEMGDFLDKAAAQLVA
uniref:hypothetical protein n=1 Tax=Acidocella sp. TaxID=50710 RepID=UPI002620FC1C